MHLREGEFEKAHTDFFEAFKNYDESGSPRRTTCLKYLGLSEIFEVDIIENMLFSPSQHVDEVWYQPIRLPGGQTLQERCRDPSHDKPRERLSEQ